MFIEYDYMTQSADGHVVVGFEYPEGKIMGRGPDAESAILDMLSRMALHDDGFFLAVEKLGKVAAAEYAKRANRYTSRGEEERERMRASFEAGFMYIAEIFEGWTA